MLRTPEPNSKLSPTRIPAIVETNVSKASCNKHFERDSQTRRSRVSLRDRLDLELLCP